MERERSFAEVDRVLRQDPDSGEAAPQDDPVTLFVSDGPGKVRVPSVRNTPQERAIKDLDKVGLKVTADPQPSDTVKKGFAIGTSPRAGAEVDRGARVRLFVSSGPERITVPDVVGVTRETAESRITGLGLEVNVETEETDEAEDGEVLRQTPEGGTQADRGDEVTIVVAQEPEQVSVPSVEGLSRADAVAALRDAGLAPTVRERATEDEAEDGTVLEQRPGAGLNVDAGDSVIIFVGAFEAAEEETPAGGGAAGLPAAGHAVRVAVLAGGRSSEHDVSLDSAEAVRAGLHGGRPRARWTCASPARAAGATTASRWRSSPAAGCWAATWRFPPCTAPTARTGWSRGLLEALDVPYVGAGVLGSALCMHKVLFKDLMARSGHPAGGLRGAAGGGRTGRRWRGSGCRCSSSPRGWARRWASAR